MCCPYEHRHQVKQRLASQLCHLIPGYHWETCWSINLLEVSTSGTAPQDGCNYDRNKIFSVLILHSTCQKMSLRPQATQTPETFPWAFLESVTWTAMLSVSNSCLVLPFPFICSILVKQFCTLDPSGSWTHWKTSTSKEKLLISYLFSCLLSFVLLGGGRSFWYQRACFFF